MTKAEQMVATYINGNRQDVFKWMGNSAKKMAEFLTAYDLYDFVYDNAYNRNEFLITFDRYHNS